MLHCHLSLATPKYHWTNFVEVYHETGESSLNRLQFCSLKEKLFLILDSLKDILSNLLTHVGHI